MKNIGLLCHLMVILLLLSFQIDSMQALLHCPNVLVCVGREPFKPVSMENLRKHSVEKLPDLAPRSNGNNVNENNESKENSGAHCIVISRPVSYSLEITGTYCTTSVCRFHVCCSTCKMHFPLSASQAFPSSPSFSLVSF